MGISTKHPSKFCVSIALGLLLAFTAWIEGAFASSSPPSPNEIKEENIQTAEVSNIADTLFIAPKIIVKASRMRPEEELFNRSGFVAFVDLDERHERVEDLSTVLSQMVGVRVRQYGGLGSFATVSIRGSSSNQVQVYLDGIPLNDAYMGITNLADLPLGGVQRIEVFRGFTPPHLGSSAIGGAVNLTTFDKSKWIDGKILSHIEFHESFGSFDTSRHRLSLWSQFWNVKFFLHGSYMTSKGNFAFIDNQGTPENPEDDEEAIRINNTFNSLNLLSRLYLDIPRLGSFSLSHDAVMREQGVPGLGSYQSENAFSNRDRYITHLRIEPKPLLSHRLQTCLSGFYSAAREQFDDPDGQISLMRQDTNNKISAYGGTSRAKLYTPLVPATIEAYLEGRKERYHPESAIPEPTSGPDRLRSSRTLSLATELYLFEQDFILSAARRYEGNTNEFYDEPRFPWLPPSPQGKIENNERTSQFGFRWHALPFVTVKGNWGIYYRLPTFLELFGNLGSVTGTADLEPEKGLNRDIGLILSADNVGILHQPFLETVYLDNEVDNLILFFPNSQHTSKPSNIGSALIKGWEISFSSFIGNQFHISGNYTRLSTEDTSEIPYYNGNQLASRPENELAILLDWIENKWKVTYELHYIGKNFIDRANLQEIPAREIHNVIIRLETPLEGFVFTAEGRNLADNRISDIYGYPLPGRTFYATLSYLR